VTIGDFSSAKDVKSQNRSYKITQTPSIAINTIKATEAVQRLLHFEVELLELSDINRICTRVRREMLENHGRSVFIQTIVNLFVVEWEKHGERLDSIQSIYQPTCGGHPMPDLEDHTTHTTCQWGSTHNWDMRTRAKRNNAANRALSTISANHNRHISTSTP